MVRKLKVYLDTSVISYLAQEDAPEKMADTQKFWKRLENGDYEAFLSQTTIAEIDRCQEAKKAILYAYLNRIAYQRLPVGHATEDFAQRVIDSRILKPRSRDDALHIAAAVLGGCDYIASWNFKHLVNEKTIRGIRAIALMDGYGYIDIVTPSALMESEE